MKRYAVIMVSEKYENDGPTYFCHQDAALLKDALVRDCDYAEQDILLELLSPDSPKTPQEVLAAVKSIVDKSQDGDTLLFYYAGHGGYSASPPFNGEPYLILPSPPSR